MAARALVPLLVVPALALAAWVVLTGGPEPVSADGPRAAERVPAAQPPPRGFLQTVGREGDDARAPGGRRAVLSLPDHVAVDAATGEVLGVVLVGRLALPGGLPVKRARFGYRVWLDDDEGGPPYEVGSLSTDAYGRFGVRLRRAEDETVGRSLVVRIGGGPGIPGAPFEARATLHPALPGANDLGALQLDSLPSLVSGYVVDEEARPVGGALLTLEVCEPGTDDWRRAPTWWAACTDDEGRFQYHARDLPGELRVTARHPRHQEVAMEGLHAGFFGVRLEMWSAGR